MATPDIPTTSSGLWAGTPGTQLGPLSIPQQQPSWMQYLGGGLAGIGNLGSILGAQGAGDAQGQVYQGQLDNSANSNLINLYNSQQNAQNQGAQIDLARQQYATNNRAATAKQALLGALLGGGYQPTHVSVPGIQTANVGGGLASSLLSNPQTLAAMQTLGRQASQAQNTPLSFTGGNIVAPPTLTPPTKISTGAAGKTGGLLQDIAGIGGAILPFLGLL